MYTIENDKIDKEELRKAIMSEYTRFACEKGHTAHFLSGKPLAKYLNYDDEILKQIPEEAIAVFAGVGNPFTIDLKLKGKIILDIGSGGGMDCMVASTLAAHDCTVIGLEITDAMIMKAEENIRSAKRNNIGFIWGEAEKIPLPDASVDIVISNGVINLCPDKSAVFAEAYRVLRKGGKLCIADVLLQEAVPNSSRSLIRLWTICVAGAVTRSQYLQLIKEQGFVNIDISKGVDVFEQATIKRSAQKFGAMGYVISADKLN